MADNNNTTRHYLRAVREKPKPVLTGRVQSVDVIGMTAIVKLGNSPSAVRLTITTSTLASRLATMVAAGQKPSVTINERNQIDGDGNTNAGNPVSTTTVIVSGINVTALNTDFYNHIADPDAHHTAFIGLSDDVNTSVNPNAGDRIKIRGTGGITVTAGTNELVITASGFVPTTRTLIAGAGLTGLGDLSADRTVNVGAGTGITVNADDVAVNTAHTFVWTAQHTYNIPLAMPPFILNSNAQGQTVVGLRADQLDKSVIAGLGLITGGVLTSDVTLDVGAGTGITVNANDVAVNQAYGFTWTGNHTWTSASSSEFQNNLTTRTLLAGSGTSDIGSPIKMYQTAYIGEIMATVFAENTIQIIGGDFYITKNGGSLPNDVTAAATAIDFGKAMLINDWVQFKNVTQSEMMQIVSFASGTTYNVNRPGTHAWPAQSAFAVWGFTGDGFIRLSASDTPQINMYLQGADSDDQSEITRIGNLNGWQGIATDKYGMALGRYQVGYPNLVFDGDDGSIRIRRYNTDVLRFDATANYLANPLLLGPDGGIFQGDGTFDIPERGLKISNSGGYGVIEGYNNFDVQASFNSLGEITWLGGKGKLNADGTSIEVDTSFSTSIGYRFVSAGLTIGGLYGFLSPSLPITSQIELSSNHPSQSAKTVISADQTGSGTSARIEVSASAILGSVSIVGGNIVVTGGNFTVNGASTSVNTTTLNIGTTTTTTLTIGRSGVVATIAGPAVFTNAVSTIPTFSGDGLYMLSNTSNRGLDGLYNRISGTSYQLSIPHVTAFPASPPTGRTVFHTTYRCFWNYDGATWRQVSIGTFNGAFPASPQDKMRVFRSDRNIEYFWNNASSEWLSTDVFEATGIGDVRTLAPYTNALTAATAVLTYHVDNTTYAVRVVESYITSMVTATNTGAAYWNYSIGYLNNNGGGGVTLLSGNTSAVAANSTTKITMSDVTIAANATAGRIAVTLNVTGSPSPYTIRGVVKYRLVG